MLLLYCFEFTHTQLATWVELAGNLKKLSLLCKYNTKVEGVKVLWRNVIIVGLYHGLRARHTHTHTDKAEGLGTADSTSW